MEKPDALDEPSPAVVSSRRSLNHGEKEEEKEETHPSTAETVYAYAADHLRRNRGDRDRILRPQFGLMRQRNQNTKLSKVLI